MRKVFKKINSYRAEKKSDEERDVVLNILFKLWDLMHEKGNTSADNYMNAAAYILLVNQDIYYLYNLHNNEKSPAKKNLFGRLLSMTIFEFLADVPELIQENMIQEIDKNNWPTALKEELAKIVAAYAKLQQNIEQELGGSQKQLVLKAHKDAKQLFAYTKMEFDHWTTFYPILRFIEGEFKQVFLKFNQASE